MNIRKTEKGITLLALVITVILLVIISTVALSSVKSNNIIEYAQNAAEDFERVQKEEEQFIDEMRFRHKRKTRRSTSNFRIGKNSGDGSFINENTTLKIVDYVNLYI